MLVTFFPREAAHLECTWPSSVDVSNFSLICMRVSRLVFFVSNSENPPSKTNTFESNCCCRRWRRLHVLVKRCRLCYLAVATGSALVCARHVCFSYIWMLDDFPSFLSLCFHHFNLGVDHLSVARAVSMTFEKGSEEQLFKCLLSWSNCRCIVVFGVVDAASWPLCTSRSAHVVDQNVTRQHIGIIVLLVG